MTPLYMHTLNVIGNIIDFFYARLDIVTLLFLVYFRIKGKHLLVQKTTALDSLNSSVIKTY